MKNSLFKTPFILIGQYFMSTSPETDNYFFKFCSLKIFLTERIAQLKQSLNCYFPTQVHFFTFFSHNLPVKLIALVQETQSNHQLRLALAFENVSSWMIAVFLMHWNDNQTLLKYAYRRWMLAVLPEHIRQTPKPMQNQRRGINGAPLSPPPVFSDNRPGIYLASKQNINTRKSL